jgi:hypothetical protein
VSTTTSAQTPVTASCCNAFYSNDVWVIWANLSINVSGPLDPDDHVSVLVQGSTWPTPTSFNDNFTPYGNGFGGGNGLGAIDCISDTNLNYCYTIGKMEAKAVPQPLGIVNIIPSNNWNLRRTVVCAFFTNATLAYSSGGKIPPTNQDDTSFAAMLYFNTTNGDFFDLDTPGCPVTFGTNIPYTAETYANFWEYMTVTLGGAPVVCSPSNTYSYVSTINTNATPSAQTNVLSPALINVRTNSVYRPR